MTISEAGHSRVDLNEAARQLEQVTHDAQVAYDAIVLGDLDWAHNSVIIACAEARAAEHVLRTVIDARKDAGGPQDR
jgi:hypothetical protein